MTDCGKIYKLIHKPNKELLYVGLTKQLLKQRLQRHKTSPSGLMRNYIFANGNDNFDIELIEDNIADFKLNERESYWIDCLNPPFNKAKTYKNKKYSTGTDGYIKIND